MTIRRLVPLVIVAAVLSSCAGAPQQVAPPAPAEKAEAPAKEVPQYTIAQFLANMRVAGASFAPDNATILASTDASGTFNVAAFPVAGGAPETLTNSTTDSLIAIGYFPFDKRLLYSADQGGNELDHVYVRELDGSVRDLTPGDKHRAQFLAWAHDGKSFFVTTNERDARYMDLYEYNAKTYKRKKLWDNTLGVDIALVSPDKRKALLVKNNSTVDTDLLLLDLGTRKTRNLTVHQGQVSHGPCAFSVDGKKLYYTTDARNEFAQLAVMDLKTLKGTPLLKTDWDVLYATLSHNGKYLVVGINNNSRTELRVYTAADMKQLPLPTVPNAEISSVEISRDEAWMAYYVTSSRVPRDLFVMKLDGSAAPLQLTHTLNPEISPDALVEGEVVQFASYDYLAIPGILYKPHQASSKHKVPAIVWVHGGPGDQSRIGYSSLIQYLVNHGYAVYAINNRGSSGYGKTFYTLDDRKHGDADLGDLVWSKRMLAATGYVDEKRIGILGGSYGGYLTLAALTFRPDDFAVGVDLFGVANWVRTLESIPPYWESFRAALYKEMGDPKTDHDRLAFMSPLSHPGAIRKPLMVLQGKNDPRVLKQESDEIVAAVQARKVPVEYLVFDDEGHGFAKKANQLRGWQAILDFLDKYLKGG